MKTLLSILLGLSVAVTLQAAVQDDVARAFLTDTVATNNVVFTNTTLLAATNSTANTNLTIDLDLGYSDIVVTNHASLTNILGLVAGKSKSKAIFITAAGGPYNLVWPTLGGASFGTRIFTNANAPVFSTLTNTLALSFTSRGTNLFLSVSEWK